MSVNPQLPSAILAQLNAWENSAQTPGPFILAVLENNLLGAIHHGTAAELSLLPLIMRHLRSEASPASWGSHDQCTLWRARGGKSRERRAWPRRGWPASSPRPNA